ncbi:phosphate metabolism protein 7 [Diaporthe australafricana]|uniref:Phosphate metabolism protein 7 n=1 Tax=Diaporthe australafricana TaxID=127596 RepID=A0ABR3W0E4_9PEZI
MRPAAAWNVGPSLVTSSNETVGSDSDQSTSLPAILAALVPSLISAVFLLTVFVLIKRPLRRIYSPRTYIDVIPEKDRTPISSLKRFEWVRTIRQLDDKFVLEHSSLDAYLYLRFLKTSVFICFVGAAITWIILFPVNATGGGDAQQLDRLGFGNVRHKDRLYAHAVVAWVFFGFVMLVIARERMWLIGLRQAWYLARANASRLSSRTVLYLDPPKEASSNSDPQQHFGDDARNQWIVTKTKSLDDEVESRDDRTVRLEFAEVSFLRQTSKKIAETRRREGLETNGDADDAAIESARPRERQYYLTGNAADLIQHLRSEVKEAVQKVGEKRESYSAESTNGHNRCAIFVEYASQSAAQRAYRGESKSRLPVPPSLAVQSRLIGVVPNEILWRNLAMPQAERLSKKSIANLLIALLIIFWSIPTAIIGTISNVNYLADNVSWLSWINSLPDPLLGLLTGFLPPFLTSQFASYLPNLMRHVAKASGQPTTVTAELQVQAWYYAFQIIQVFLVTALSSSATAFIPKIINEPHHVPQLLADNLPKSSNFYLTYFILQGLACSYFPLVLSPGSANYDPTQEHFGWFLKDPSVKNMMNWSDLLEYLFFEMFIYKTPRDKYKQYTSLKGIAWGKVYPKFTNFVIIALAYSCISPLVLGFAAVGLSLFYFSYRYTLLFMVQPKIETKGKCYTRALQQILAGIYIGELCLIGLFSLRKAKGPAAMLVVLFLATIAYNILTNRYLNPLEDHFPDDMLSVDAENGEQDPLLSAAEEGQAVAAGDAQADEHERSRVQRLGREMHLPQKVVSPIARFLEPHVYASHKAMRAFLARTGAETDPAPEYSEQDIKKAYQNPSLTSNSPIIWLPRDDYGLSKKEVESLSAENLEATDEGAWVNSKGEVDFERSDLRGLPVWKQPKAY